MQIERSRTNTEDDDDMRLRDATEVKRRDA